MFSLSLILAYHSTFKFRRVEEHYLNFIRLLRKLLVRRFIGRANANLSRRLIVLDEIYINLIAYNGFTLDIDRIEIYLWVFIFRNIPLQAFLVTRFIN